MEIIEFFYRELISFLGLRDTLEILKSGDFSVFLTFDGIITAIGPILPLLLVLELINGLILKNPHAKVYKITFLIYIVIIVFISIID